MSEFPIHKPRWVEFIQQRGKSDCGIACVAMLVGCLYEPIRELFINLGKSSRGGLYPEDIFEVLEIIGFQARETKQLSQNCKALVAIQWKNPDLSGHYVVWDNKRKQFLDPIYGVFGKTELKKHAIIEDMWKVFRGKR